MNAIILGVSIFFFGMGFTALSRPTWIMSLFKTALTTSDGRNEVRAVYGGYGLAMGGLLVYCLYNPELKAGITLCVAFSMLGMAVGRLISFIVELKIGFFFNFVFCHRNIYCYIIVYLMKIQKRPTKRPERASG